MTTPTRLRLQILPPTSLPTHPALAPTQTNSPPIDLSTFIRETLRESLHFADTTIPSSFTKKGAPKPSPPSAAKVQFSTYEEPTTGDFWAARSSVHVDEVGEGTASYEELQGGLFEEHSVHEMDYTPDVYDARRICDWGSQIKEMGENPVGGEFTPVLELYEMCHNLPTPLTHRCFSTLVLRAKTAADAFVVVQLPVDISKTDAAFYSNGRHRSEGEAETMQREKVLMGRYVSVERVKPVVEGGAEAGEGGAGAGGEGGAKRYSWEMATSSDAAGYLPMSLQKMGIQGAVVKDVGFFMKWRGEQRKKA
ncbi:MAG: hypothetical protein M1828_006571 [Chrysothrix sp. TS-e1954]|nr:MAG: hypothetical protein M1828_006571 [Chrysothrix sp. TS-e1954]